MRRGWGAGGGGRRGQDGRRGAGLGGGWLLPRSPSLVALNGTYCADYLFNIKKLNEIVCVSNIERCTCSEC